MYAILASVLKYIFITIIYLFIFGIIRMIFLDIRKLDVPRPRELPPGGAYLRLLTNRNSLYFDVNESYPLGGDAVIIGRGTDCEISVDDLYMSTQHVQLWREDGEWYIADMGSTNGTYVNGERMADEPLILDSGDVIKVGQLEFQVVL